MKRYLTLVLILFFLERSLGASVGAANYQDEAKQKLHHHDFQQVERVPELKSDLPKFDKPKIEPPHAEAQHHSLKGGVQHHEMLDNKHLMGKEQAGNAQFDGVDRHGKLDGNAHKRAMRGNVNQAEDQANLGIIGVKFVMFFGRLPIIYEVFPGTPAAEVGMLPRDVIVAVDGVPTMGLTKEEVYNMIVGQPDTPVTISYRRKNDFKVQQITRMDLNRVRDPHLKRDYLRM